MTLQEAYAKTGTKTRAELAEVLGITVYAVYNWNDERISRKRADQILDIEKERIEAGLQ